MNYLTTLNKKHILQTLRGWYSGCALAFQASETGSIPVPRSIIGNNHE